MGDKFAMDIINMGSKRPSAMGTEDQVAQSVKVLQKIVNANVGNDESTSLGNDVQFEIQPAGGILQRKRTNKVRFGIAFGKTVLNPTTSLEDIWARPNLIKEYYS